MHRLILSGGSVILPDAVLESASVVVERETIVAVEQRAYPAGRSAHEQVVDVGGRYVLPGLVDLHNDGLETEINPRPGTNLPLPFALANLDRQLAATGVTTEFHAIFFGNMTSKERRLEQAVERVLAIVEHGRSGRALVDHQVLFRLDLWTPGEPGEDPGDRWRRSRAARLAERPHARPGPVPRPRAAEAVLPRSARRDRGGDRGRDRAAGHPGPRAPRDRGGDPGADQPRPPASAA